MKVFVSFTGAYVEINDECPHIPTPNPLFTTSKSSHLCRCRGNCSLCFAKKKGKVSPVDLIAGALALRNVSLMTLWEGLSRDQRKQSLPHFTATPSHVRRGSNNLLT